jgi:peroxiredoxin
MKTYIIALCLCLIALKASSQSMADMFPKGSEIYIKNGPKISADKVDSVISSWGGRFSMEHAGNKIYIAPSTPADAQRFKDLAAASMTNLNQPAPDFSLTDVQGRTVSLVSLKGKVVVLNFWFTTCLACIAEMPDLNKLQQAYKGKDVVFLGLGRDDKNRIRQFSTMHQFDYQLLTNAVKTATDYKVEAYPTSMVIDKNGIIKYVQVSADNITEKLGAAINAAL